MKALTLFREEGQGMVEYAVLLSLMALTILTALGLMGNSIVTSLYNFINML
ncbi:MAG: Flp family type IVb pilin [Chloroflexi bacterium]|nr:Flp family type IVb pilin [Chloroflexota bacterium]